MTKQQYIDWIHSANHVATDYNEYDSNGNHYARDIFENDGKLYSVEYVNGELMDQVELDDQGKAVRRGVYTLKEVKEETTETTRYRYVAEEIT